MAEFLTIYIMSFVFSFLYSKSKDKSSIIIFLTLSFLILFLPLALRYGIGTDYNSYVQIASSAIAHKKYFSFEIGWAPILWLIAQFDLDIQIFFVIPAFFTILILFVVIPRKYFWLCIPAYISIAYLESFSLVRQSFAASILLLSIRAFYNKKNILALFWFALSVLFHKSVVFMFPLFLLSIFRWKFLNVYTSVFIFVCSCAFFSVFNVASFLMQNVLGNSIYAGYIGGGYDKKTELGSGLGLLLRLVMFAVFLFCIRRSARTNEGSLFISRRYVYTVFSLYMLSAAHILAAQIHIFNRIPNLFSPFYVYVLIAVVQSKSRYRKIVLIFTLSVLFIFFIKTLQVSSSSLGRGLGIVPYKSIFER